ncbi:MAG: Rpn family recombination-promoting nuclease/putative transposase [Eubacteriales bacterium]|nr:Rpn family recombination-promoting nuclease/putative transposase [Eubacteriales bacterium]
MQEKDAVGIKFFKDKRRFADLINGHLFGGKEFVKAENVQTEDRSSVLIRNWRGKLSSKVLMRDIVRFVSVHMKVALVAVENQSDIHYAMPVRIMTADSVNYYEQWRETAKEHREKKDLKDAEFLSGFGKKDRLVPVITIVVYFGSEPWDGPTSLKEMLDLEDMPDELLHAVADYPMQLLEVRSCSYLERFRTDLQYVFGFIQNAESSEKLKSYVDEHKEIFGNLQEDAYDMISVMTNSSELESAKEKCKTSKGGHNVCRAIQEMITEGVQQGFQDGFQDGFQKGEQQGYQKGERYTLQLAKSVFQLRKSGADYKEIARKCHVLEDKVKEILEDIEI